MNKAVELYKNIFSSHPMQLLYPLIPFYMIAFLIMVYLFSMLGVMFMAAWSIDFANEILANFDKIGRGV